MLSVISTAHVKYRRAEKILIYAEGRLSPATTEVESKSRGAVVTEMHERERTAKAISL